jgi:hypothetical protein
VYNDTALPSTVVSKSALLRGFTSCFVAHDANNISDKNANRFLILLSVFMVLSSQRYEFLGKGAIVSLKFAIFALNKKPMAKSKEKYECSYSRRLEGVAARGI